jgi:hypothetical protein
MANDLLRLHRFIGQHYDLEELRTLCFDLGIRYDDLGGEGIGAKARELVLLLGRCGRFDQLLIALRQSRPQLLEQIGLEITPDAIKALYAALPSFEARKVRPNRWMKLMKLKRPLQILLILLATVVIPDGLMVWLTMYMSAQNVDRVREPAVFLSLTFQLTAALSIYTVLWGIWLYPKLRPWLRFQMQGITESPASKQTSSQDMVL